MKRNNINQKLTLNKKTISSLNGKEMIEIKGGSTPIFASAAAATIFLEGHEASWWACEFTHKK